MCPSHEGSLSLSEINSSKHSVMVMLFLTALTDIVSISLLFSILRLLYYCICVNWILVFWFPLMKQTANNYFIQ